MRILSFASGNVWRWSAEKNRAGPLRFLYKLDISGVEITFSKKEELYSFKLNSKQIKWLKSFDYVSIHAPFKLVRRADNEKEIFKQLEYIAKIYKLVNAKNVIIHAKDLPARRILARYKMNFSTENTVKKGKRFVGKRIGIRELARILKKNPKLGLCLDVAHAYFWGRNETRNLIKKFKKRITQVHLSGNYRKHDHVSMKIVSREFMRSIKPIFGLDVPIIIEEDMKIKNIKKLKAEIAHIKSLF